MADNLGPNGLVVAAGKCAGPIPAENRTSCEKSIRTQIYVMVEANFLLPLGQLIFRQKQPGHWGRGCLPFSPFFYIEVFFAFLEKTLIGVT